MLAGQKWQVLHSVHLKDFEVKSKNGIPPFLPVIPLSQLSIREQMLMVQNGYRMGGTLLDPLHIFDSEQTPFWPYYIFDIRYRADFLRRDPKLVKRIYCVNEGLSGFTVAEAIAFCVHGGIFSNERVAAIGSYYQTSEHFPVIFVGDEERPQLSFFIEQTEEEPCYYPLLKRRIGPKADWAD